MEQWNLWGTIVNALAVTGGALIGMLLGRLFGGRKKSERAEALRDTLFKGVGLCALAIGITGTVKGAGERILIIILSMALGGTLGQLLDLDRAVGKLGERVEQMAHARNGTVAEGFVSASLLFCVGSMTVVGSLNSGLLCDHTMLYTKSMLDFVSAIVFAPSFGIGVLFSAVFVLVFQGSITLLAQWVAPFLSADVVTCMTGVGSILIIGLALNMLGITKLKIMNYMPALILPVLLIPLSDWLTALF